MKNRKRRTWSGMKRFSVWLVFDLERCGWKDPLVCVMPAGRIPTGAAVWHYATHALSVEDAAAEYRYLEAEGKIDRRYNPIVHGIPMGCATEL